VRRRVDGGVGLWCKEARNLIKAKSSVLFSHLPKALAGDEEAVHQLRVESRRMRVALKLLTAKPEGRRAKRSGRLLQRLTRTAGVRRDLDVLLEIYDQRLRALPERTPEQTRLRRRLADARRRGCAHMVDAMLDLEISRFREDLRDLVDGGCAPVPVVDERVRELVSREGTALSDGLHALGATLDSVALHDLRRRARRLRYGLEVAQKILDEDKGVTKPWKVLQDLIGSMHDYHVLGEWLAKQAAADGKRGNSKMVEAALAEMAWTEAEVTRLHHQFLAARPAGIVQQALSLLRREALQAEL
jgi:CHAD domain-containing protein